MTKEVGQKEVRGRERDGGSEREEGCMSFLRESSLCLRWTSRSRPHLFSVVPNGHTQYMVVKSIFHTHYQSAIEISEGPPSTTPKAKGHPGKACWKQSKKVLKMHDSAVIIFCNVHIGCWPWIEPWVEILNHERYVWLFGPHKMRQDCYWLIGFLFSPAVCGTQPTLW